MSAKDDSYHLILSSFEDEYEENHDPIWAWHAIDFCSNWQRKTGQLLPYPSWVQDYLSMAAELILRIDCDSDTFNKNIGASLGIRQDSISSSIQTIRDKVIFFEIQSMIKKGSDKKAAVETAAQIFSLPADSVHKIYERFAGSV